MRRLRVAYTIVSVGPVCPGIRTAASRNPGSVHREPEG